MLVVFDDEGLDSLNYSLLTIFGVSWRGLPNTNRELGECGHAPHNDDVAPLTEPLLITEYLGVHVEDLFVINHVWLSVWMLAGAIDEHLTELTYEPNTQLDETGVIPIAIQSIEYLGNCILMQLRRGRDDRDDL